MLLLLRPDVDASGLLTVDRCCIDIGGTFGDSTLFLAGGVLVVMVGNEGAVCSGTETGMGGLTSCKTLKNKIIVHDFASVHPILLLSHCLSCQILLVRYHNQCQKSRSDCLRNHASIHFISAFYWFKLTS